MKRFILILLIPLTACKDPFADPIPEEQEAFACDYDTKDALDKVHANEFIYSYKHRELFEGRRPAETLQGGTMQDVYRFLQVDNETSELCFFAEIYVDAWTGRVSEVNRDFISPDPDVYPYPDHKPSVDQPDEEPLITPSKPLKPEPSNGNNKEIL
jgi:hypothetical protein